MVEKIALSVLSASSVVNPPAWPTHTGEATTEDTGSTEDGMS